MTELKELEWGQTPWDGMSRNQLLQELWRFYLATQSVYGILEPMRNREVIPFWGKSGRGGAAVARCEQALAHAATYKGEDVYRSFFRYAPDLLFDPSGAEMLTFGWAICDKCGVMLGRTVGSNTNRHLGQPCSESKIGDKDCTGAFRPLKWADLGKPEMDEDE